MLAILGSVLMTMVQLLFTINSYIGGYSLGVFGVNVPTYIINLMCLIGYILLLFFFITLYNKQNK